MDTHSLNGSVRHRVTVIVPQLPPVLGPLGDYSLNLAHQLRQGFGVESQFIVTDPTWPYGSNVETFNVRAVSRPTSTALCSLLTRSGASSVLIHYATGNGVSTSAGWVLDGIEQWHDAARDRHLVSMFHDLYHFGPVWTGAFWNSPRQRRRVSCLARLSDRVLTNCQSNAVKLWMLSRGKHTSVPTLPIVSTLGEPADILPLADRPRSLVVMGTGRDRQTLYTRSHDTLTALCAALQVEVIHEVGTPMLVPIHRIGNTPIHSLGLNPPEVTSKLLSSATVGVLEDDPALLATSSTFAAYCAHGLIPVGIAEPAQQEADGLRAGRHYWVAPAHLPDISWDAGQAIATRAHRWYQSHTLKTHARVFARSLLVRQTSTTSPHHQVRL